MGPVRQPTHGTSQATTHDRHAARWASASDRQAGAATSEAEVKTDAHTYTCRCGKKSARFNSRKGAATPRSLARCRPPRLSASSRARVTKGGRRARR
jgi:hypothetical protein